MCSARSYGNGLRLYEFGHCLESTMLDYVHWWLAVKFENRYD